MTRLLDQLFAFCASLKLAVITILSLATLLGVATFYEARYGGPAVQAQIYSSRVFVGVLSALAINVMASALIRYPWKRKQTGFVVTHVGILTLLAGCLISFRGSVDGRLVLKAGDQAKDFATNEERLQVSLEGKTYVLPGNFWTEAGYPTALEALTFRWGEPGWRGGNPTWELGRGAKLEVLQWLPAARFEEAVTADATGGPVVDVKLLGSTPNGQVVDQTARVTPGEVPLFGGIVVARLTDGGDVGAFLKPEKPAELSGMTRGIVEFLSADGKLYYRAFNKDGLRGSGEVEAGKELVKFLAISVSAGRYVPHAKLEQGYVAARIAPKKMVDADRAAKVALTVDGERQEVWLARGAAARPAMTPRGAGTLAYGFAGRDLPFTVSLLSARQTNKPGTNEPDAYESDVMMTLPDGSKPRGKITMNQPVTQDGYTLYQARLESGGGEAISTLSIRRDPGTLVKYVGSALVCTGIFLMFFMKSYFQKPAATKAEKREMAEVTA